MRSPLIDRLIEINKGKLLILGHRGVRKDVKPENTIPAFEEALCRGASGIEMDVESTLDGQLIVANRWYLHSHFGFFPWERSLKAIQALAKEEGDDIPDFSETCDFIKNNLNTLLTVRLFHRTIETAYLFRSVDRVLNPEDKNKWKYKVNSFINWTGTKGFMAGTDTLHPEISLFPLPSQKKENFWMKAARWRGKRINAWTVDTREDLSKAMQAGVRIMISDQVHTVI